MTDTSYVPTDQRVRHSASTKDAWLAYAPESFDRWLAAHDARVRTETLEEAATLVESCIGCITEPLQECAKDGDSAAQFFGRMHAEQIRALAIPENPLYPTGYKPDTSEQEASDGD
jgi:hypothetical protein